MRRGIRGLVAVMAACFVLPAGAAERVGITLPDDLEVGGKALVLNGLGLREATFLKVDVYVAGLYVGKKTQDPDAILNNDGPWVLDMHFVRKVGRDDITKAWSEGFKKNKAPGSMSDKLDTLNSHMSDMDVGDTMRFSYLPNDGLEITVKGESKGKIEGADFARAFLSVFIGPKPPNPGLKTGLLGN